MRLFRNWAVWIGLAAAASAESAGGGWERVLPGPGDRTVVRATGGPDETWIVLEPNREVRLAPPAGASRFRVESVPIFARRDEPEAEYEFFVRVDAEPEARVAHRTTPTKTFTIRGRDWIPGSTDKKVFDLKGDASHTVRVRLAGTRSLPVLVRFEIDVARAESDGAPRAAVGPGWRFGGAYTFQIAYDDNVFRFGSTDRRNLAKASTSDKFDRMEEPWDFILTNRLDAWIGYGTRADSFSVGALVTDRRYLQNSIKSTDEIEGYARLELWNVSDFRLSGWWRPGNFIRNIDSIEVPGTARVRCDYDELGAGLRWRQAWARVFSTRLGYELIEKDYNSDFDERDRIQHRFRLGFRIEPVEFLYADARFDYDLARAAASSGEPDTSFNQYGPRLEIGTRIGGFFAGTSWLFEYQEYTTSNSTAEDPGHADRVDKRNRWEIWAGYRFDLGKSVGLDFKLSYAYDRNDTTLPSDTSTATTLGSEEGREYRANIVELEVQLRF